MSTANSTRRVVIASFIGTTGAITTGGALTLAATSTDEVTTLADATTVGAGATGIGVAVAFGLVGADTRAWLEDSGSLSATGGTQAG